MTKTCTIYAQKYTVEANWYVFICNCKMRLSQIFIKYLRSLSKSELKNEIMCGTISLDELFPQKGFTWDCYYATKWCALFPERAQRQCEIMGNVSYFEQKIKTKTQ